MSLHDNCIGEVKEAKKPNDAAEGRKMLLELKRHCDPLLKVRLHRAGKPIDPRSHPHHGSGGG